MYTKKFNCAKSSKLNCNLDTFSNLSWALGESDK